MLVSKWNKGDEGWDWPTLWFIDLYIQLSVLIEKLSLTNDLIVDDLFASRCEGSIARVDNEILQFIAFYYLVYTMDHKLCSFFSGPSTNKDTI